MNRKTTSAILLVIVLSYYLYQEKTATNSDDEYEKTETLNTLILIIYQHLQRAKL